MSNAKMAFRAVISSKLPMVIILGATGTGKTKLGVELAQKYGSEVISADSMQIYKGLDVVTAKASAQERAAVTHHLLDLLEPHQMFTVVDFRNRALKIIDSLTEQGKIPIIVGGTNYYIESIVYQILVEEMNDSEALLWDKSRRKRDSDDKEIDAQLNKRAKTECDEKNSKTAGSITDDSKPQKLETPSNEEDKTSEKEVKEVEISKDMIQELVDKEKELTNEEIHERLSQIDPVMATRLHPNNRRKLLRSIEVWLKTGRRHSEILDEQKLTEGKLRKPGNTLIFWLKCEQSVHDERLDARVDAMLQQGLVEELLDFHARHNRQRIQDGSAPDYTKGVFQTLGLKEFHDYLMLPEDQRHSAEGKKLFEQSVENMKSRTRRYARRQNKMIRGRFLDHPDREVPPIYELDTTDLSEWDSQVKNKAIKIIESYLNDTECEFEPLKPFFKEKKNINNKSANKCEVCHRLIIGDKQWAIHLESNRHNKVVKKRLAEQKKGGKSTS